MYSVGVDIGGSHISCGVFDHKSRKLIKETLSYKKVNPHGSKSEILENWICALKEALEKLNKPILGVGIAMPGPFDYYNGISKITDVEKLQSLYNVNLRAELANLLDINPTQIRFINDASAFSIAEARIGLAASYKRIVAITLGTGLGASFTINGSPIVKDKRVPDGGFLYNQYYQNVLADELFSTRGIINAYALKTGKEVKDVKTLYDNVKNEPEAKETLNEFGEKLADFLYPYLVEFGAEALVLGGNISKAFEFFGNPIRKKLNFLDKIYVSEFGEEAAIIGSALLLDEDFYAEIKNTLKLM